MEFGPGGAEMLDAGPGDFVFVATNAVHRESNPSDEDSRIVVVRSGSGPPLVNVDGPEPLRGSVVGPQRTVSVSSIVRAAVQASCGR